MAASRLRKGKKEKPMITYHLLPWWIWHRTRRLEEITPDDIAEAMEDFRNRKLVVMHRILHKKHERFRLQFLPPEEEPKQTKRRKK